MGTAAYGGDRLKEGARVGGEGPTGAAGLRQQYIQGSCQPPPPSPTCNTFVMPCCMQTMRRNAEMQQVHTLTVRLVFSHQFASSCILRLLEAMGGLLGGGCVPQGKSTKGPTSTFA